VVQLLLRKEADVEVKDKDRLTVLYIVTGLEHKVAAQLLFKKRTNVEAKRALHTIYCT
jgi:hypothetical protein